MSIVAIIPVAGLISANAVLAGLGHGENCFSIPAYSNTGTTHAALHAWDDPVFAAHVKTPPGVVTEESIGDPVARTQALISAQGAQWGDHAQALPTSGNALANTLYRYDDDTLWWCIQTFSRTTYSAHPSTYPALIRRVRNPRVVEAWRQPIDQYDAYKLVNPFTGQPDQVTYNGETWYVTGVDGSGNNVWEPGVFGWTIVGQKPKPEATWVDTGSTVTGQAGQLFYISTDISTLGLTAGQAIRFGNSLETTYVQTWPGTTTLMQINPYVLAQVGMKVWKWA